jgi:hypothetical protein
MPTYAFANAPRAHMGLRVDEVPIIAQRGERVLNQRETAAYERGGAGRPSIGEIRVYLDGSEVGGRMRVVADGVVVERNRRGLNTGTGATTRVYS